MTHHHTEQAQCIRACTRTAQWVNAFTAATAGNDHFSLKSVQQSWFSTWSDAVALRLVTCGWCTNAHCYESRAGAECGSCPPPPLPHACLCCSRPPLERFAASQTADAAGIPCNLCACSRRMCRRAASRLYVAGAAGRWRSASAVIQGLQAAAALPWPADVWPARS